LWRQKGRHCACLEAPSVLLLSSHSPLSHLTTLFLLTSSHTGYCTHSTSSSHTLLHCCHPNLSLPPHHPTPTFPPQPPLPGDRQELANRHCWPYTLPTPPRFLLSSEAGSTNILNGKLRRASLPCAQPCLPAHCTSSFCQKLTPSPIHTFTLPCYCCLTPLPLSWTGQDPLGILTTAKKKKKNTHPHTPRTTPPPPLLPALLPMQDGRLEGRCGCIFTGTSPAASTATSCHGLPSLTWAHSSSSNMVPPALSLPALPSTPCCSLRTCTHMQHHCLYLPSHAVTCLLALCNITCTYS